LVTFGVDGPALVEVKALRSVSAAHKTRAASYILKQLRV